MDCCYSRDETNMPGDGFPHHPSAYGAGAQRAFQSYASPVSAVDVSVPRAPTQTAKHYAFWKGLAVNKRPHVMNEPIST